jgi:hypothetical protein
VNLGALQRGGRKAYLTLQLLQRGRRSSLDKLLTYAPMKILQGTVILKEYLLFWKRLLITAIIRVIMMERLLFHNYVRIIKNTKQKLLFQ